MLQSARVWPVLLCGLCLIGSADPARADSKREVISEITEVNWIVEVSQPPNLVVTAKGKIHKGGYTKESLERVRYTVPPSDGIQDYVLSAMPASGPVPTVEGTVTAQHRWKRFTEEAPWLKGIRVHGAAEGIVVKMLNEGDEPPDQDADETFTGESEKGNFQEALDAAIAAASKKLGEGGADQQIAWTLKSTTGVQGGIPGARTVTVTISARLN